MPAPSIISCRFSSATRTGPVGEDSRSLAAESRFAERHRLAETSCKSPMENGCQSDYPRNTREIGLTEVESTGMETVEAVGAYHMGTSAIK